jgi:hypothetical protein
MNKKPESFKESVEQLNSALVALRESLADRFGIVALLNWISKRIKE